MRAILFAMLVGCAGMSSMEAVAQQSGFHPIYNPDKVKPEKPEKVKAKAGIIRAADKSKPLRAEIEEVFARRADAVKRRDAEAQIALLAPDFISIQPDGSTMNYEQVSAYMRRLSGQAVEMGDLRIEAEIINFIGNEAIIEARQHIPRRQRLADGKVHDVYTTVLQTETWVRTPDGWKERRCENEREQTFLVDGKPVNADGTPKN